MLDPSGRAFLMILRLRVAVEQRIVVCSCFTFNFLDASFGSVLVYRYTGE